MVETFFELVTATTQIGTVTEFAMYRSGMITIDGIERGGKPFHLTYRCDEGGDTDGKDS